jgi:hypothetical protein
MTKFCYNCDDEATCYVEWNPTPKKWVYEIPISGDEGKPKRTYMCFTCATAFELGQALSNEPVKEID